MSFIARIKLTLPYDHECASDLTYKTKALLIYLIKMEKCKCIQFVLYEMNILSVTL